MYGTLDDDTIDKFHSARYVEGASMMGYARGIAKGIAPQARIAVYKVCWVNGCFDSDVVFAIDQALDDGVDVISMSIAGQNTPYFIDNFVMATFEAAKRGVLVSVPASNYGPKA